MPQPLPEAWSCWKVVLMCIMSVVGSDMWETRQGQGSPWCDTVRCLLPPSLCKFLSLATMVGKAGHYNTKTKKRKMLFRKQNRERPTVKFSSVSLHHITCFIKRRLLLCCVRLDSASVYIHYRPEARSNKAHTSTITRPEGNQSVIG